MQVTGQRYVKHVWVLWRWLVVGSMSKGRFLALETLSRGRCLALGTMSTELLSWYTGSEAFVQLLAAVGSITGRSRDGWDGWTYKWAFGTAISWLHCSGPCVHTSVGAQSIDCRVTTATVIAAACCIQRATDSYRQ